MQPRMILNFPPISASRVLGFQVHHKTWIIPLWEQTQRVPREHPANSAISSAHMHACSYFLKKDSVREKRKMVTINLCDFYTIFLLSSDNVGGEILLVY